MHYIPMATAPMAPFTLIHPSIVALIFLFIVMCFAIRNVRTMIKLHDTLDAWWWSIVTIIVLGLNVVLTMIDIVGIIRVAPDGTPVPPFQWFNFDVFNIVSMIILLLIWAVISLQAYMVFDGDDGQGHYHKLRSISWFGFSLIALSVLMWDGVFRVGLLGWIRFLNYGLIFGIILWVGMAMVIIGWIVFGSAKVRRRQKQMRAIRAY